jgi:hypothetical protein
MKFRVTGAPGSTSCDPEIRKLLLDRSSLDVRGQKIVLLS